jgi:hypothetical protein
MVLTAIATDSLSVTTNQLIMGRMISAAAEIAIEKMARLSLGEDLNQPSEPTKMMAAKAIGPHAPSQMACHMEENSSRIRIHMTQS